jgi:uncharacterized protein (TIGR02588 family)
MPASDKRNKRPLLEWTTSGAGLALAAGMLGVLGWEAFQGGQTVPAVAVEIVQVVETPAGFTVEVRAVNHGDMTASDVAIEGELRRGEEVVETSETTFTYLPGASERRGGLFFTEDPRSGSLNLRPLGYVEP